MPNISLANTNNSRNFWPGNQEEKTILFKEKDSQENPYRLVVIGIINHEIEGIKSVSGTIMGSVPALYQSYITGVGQNHDVTWNVEHDAENIIERLLLEEGNNVVVDIFGQQIFMNNKEVMKNFEEQGLDKTFTLQFIEKYSSWKDTITKIITESVEEYLKEIL